MKKQLITLLALSALSPSLWAVSYDQNITAIFGTGNPNTGWTADSQNGLQLGLRAKARIGGSTANVSGTYSFATAPATRGLWNYEFSINSDSVNGTAPLTSYDYYLAVDRDPSQGVLYSVVDPLAKWADNAYGNNSTANGAGTVGTATALAGLNNVAQNSENITFSDYPGGALPLDPNATYSYELYAVAKGTGVNGTKLADVGITVVVGNGGAAVPDAASTCTLLGVAFTGLAALRRKLVS